MICKNEGCGIETKSRNGYCPNCYRSKKDFKRYMLTKDGKEQLALFLLQSHRLKLVSIDEE